MANFLDKMKVKIASKDHVKLDLSCDHVSSANFMQYNVAWTKELVPNEKISVSMETFTRLNPMPVPTFGRASINNRAFFVPFRTIFPAWTDFITDTTHTFADGQNGVVSNVPQVTALSLSQLFFLPDDTTLSELLNEDISVYDGDYLGYDYVVNGGAHLAKINYSTNNPDFTVYVGTFEVEDGTETITRAISIPVTLTAKGRQIMKVLNSLGYQIYPNLDDNGTETNYSALPILAMAKVYCDWYYPSAYSQNTLVQNVEKLFSADGSTVISITDEELVSIFDLIRYVNYDSDYFVSAWDKPYSPNDDTISSDYSLVDPTNGSNTVSYDATSGAPGLDSISGTITQWAIDALKGVTDYIKRHQLVGSRALDRYMARFGINLSPEKLRRSVYIGSGSTAIKFGDVTSTSDTAGASLGDYAGKGIGYDTNNFEFETDEFGIMIIISTIQPKTGYYQGLDRNVFHTHKADYWTPEFDNLGVQGISKSELFIPTVVTNSFYDGEVDDYHSGIFGYTPRYAEYKVGRDRLTGDLRLKSVDAGAGAWHTMRQVDFVEPLDVAHNLNFVRGIDADQYSRIFYNTNAEDNDKFNVIYSFDIASWSPMKALFDTYDFDGGQKVSMDVNGVKMN